MTHALPLFGRWTAARVRMTLRTPRAMVFTFAFPVVLLVLFNGLNSGRRVAAVGAGKVDFAQFYTPSIGVFCLAVASYTTLAIGLATARDLGLLKRVRGTPLPMPVYLGAWLTGAVLVGLVGVALMFAIAVPAFGVQLYARLLPAAFVTLVLGAIALGALGFALASVVRSVDQAQPAAQLTFFPLSFISGIWFPLRDAPGWVVHLADVFPLSHLVRAFSACFQAQTAGGGWRPVDLAVLGAWAVAGLAIAARRLGRERRG